MIELLKRLTKVLAAETPVARRVAEQTGTIESGGEPNVPYKVQPADKSVKEIRVVHNAQTGKVSQVVLIPSELLPMSQLVAAFGDYTRLPSLPNPKEPPRVSFDIEAANGAHSVSLIVGYEGDDPAQSQVVKVFILRD
jgi:hypothetical protein